MYLESGHTIYLRRDNGIEVQYRLLCPGCKLFCAYRPVPIDQPSRYIYLLYDGFSDTPIGMNKPSDQNISIPSSIYKDEFGNVCVKVELNPGQMRSRVTEINEEYVKFNLAVMPGNEGKVNMTLLNYCSILLSLPASAISLDLDDNNRIILQISEKGIEDVFNSFNKELQQ